MSDQAICEQDPYEPEPTLFFIDYQPYGKKKISQAKQSIKETKQP